VRALLLSALAFAAGFLGWRVAAPAPPLSRAAAPVAASAPEAPPLPEAAEARELRRRLALLETVPLRDLVRYGNEPLGDRMRRARGLAESERRETLRDWARFAVYDRARSQEMLALVRVEEDPEILSWLAEMIDLACLMKMNLDATYTDEEKRGVFPLALSGEPPERRVAALRVIGGDRSEGLPSEVQALLSDVLRGDPEPAVVAVAAEEIEQRYAPDTVEALLDAWRRLPSGEPRQRVARAYAKWVKWADLKQRFAEARGPLEHDEWARAWAAHLSFFEEGWDKDLPSIYGGTGDRDVRRSLFLALTNVHPWRRDLMREVAGLEADADLKDRYQRVLASEPTKIDAYATLYK